MKPDVYRLIRPRQIATPVIFASPHSGRAYASAFLDQSVLDPLALRSSEDAFVDELFAAAKDFGACLLLAETPRAFLDFNRAPDELDPALIEGIARAPHNPRVSSGIGVIPRVVSGGRAIYRGKLPMAEAEARLRDHWYPYHAALRDLVEETHRRFGEAILIDLHSMPREAVEQHLRPGHPRPDVVLGDRFGASASARITGAVEAAFVEAGLRVARNAPFAGAFIAQSYGRPVSGRHVVQVEVDRGLYLDEARIQRSRGFGGLKQTMTDAVARIIDSLSPGRAGAEPIAAE